MYRPMIMKGVISALVIAVLASCGGGSGDQGNAKAKPANPNGLTDFQMQNGIGPIFREVTVGTTIDAAMADSGQALFVGKCSACHKLDERYVGPSLREVTERRTPTYIMNMVMNPEGMINKHPVAKDLFTQFLTPMANQNVTQGQARALVEYLRKADKEK